MTDNRVIGPASWQQRITTGSWRHARPAPDDAVVGISRGVPRWRLPYFYQRCLLLAPARSTFKLPLPEYRPAYLAQLEALGVERILTMLAGYAQTASDGPKAGVLLLCWEDLSRPGTWCHRRMLADWLTERTGLVIPEQGPETVTPPRLPL